MKFIATLDADLDTTPLDTVSRLAEPMAGIPVLRRTVDRLLQCRKLHGIAVTFPQPQAERVAAILGDLAATEPPAGGQRAAEQNAPAPVYLRPRTPGQPPYRALVRAARKWSLDAWRGGLGGACAFDEYMDVELAAAIASAFAAHAVVVVPPGAALLDPRLCDDMIDHATRYADEIRLTFSQAPPGLAPAIFQSVLCQQLAANKLPPGWTLAYKPDDPTIDLAFKPACFAVPESVRYASGRLTADTTRSVRAMLAILEEGVGDDAASIGRWLMKRESTCPGQLPREIEIELTTDDSLPKTLLRPRGDRVPGRGPMDLDMLKRLTAEIAREDDTLVVLGGHGDPVLHPEFSEALHTLRREGIHGITVYTTGQALSDEAIQALIAARVDAVVFLLDAWTEATFERINRSSGLETARQSISRLLTARQAAGRPEPIVAPQLTKCTENLAELDEFFDGWMRANGCATLAGYSTRCGRLPDLSVIDMTPPTRIPCRRLMSRCVVLADGTVSACDQDFAGELVLGHLGEQTMEQAWGGTRARRLRDHHSAGNWDAQPLCGPCTEWHRP